MTTPKTAGAYHIPVLLRPSVEALRPERPGGIFVDATLGGGGHTLASGCMLFGEYEEVIERLTYAVFQHL